MTFILGHKNHVNVTSQSYVTSRRDWEKVRAVSYAKMKCKSRGNKVQLNLTIKKPYTKINLDPAKWSLNPFIVISLLKVLCNNKTLLNGQIFQSHQRC